MEKSYAIEEEEKDYSLQFITVVDEIFKTEDLQDETLGPVGLDKSKEIELDDVVKKNVTFIAR